jgi:predicted GIY-YIG superfamily endonuclease
MNRTVYLYVIGREQGPVKVGISASPESRLGQIQTGCPFKCGLLHVQLMRDRNHALSHERTFQEVYTKYRLIGEWFKLDAELAIEGIETGLEFEEYFEKRAAGAAA